MKDRNTPAGQHSVSPRSQPPRRSFFFDAAIVAAGLLIAFFAFKSFKNSPTAELQTRVVAATAPPAAAEPREFKPLVAAPAHDQVGLDPSAPRSVAELMAELEALSSSRGPITAEQAAQFKKDLAELIQQGATSVPAIRAFLDKNVDFNFASLDGGEQLSYPSLRAGLFDVLKQIGGPEAQATMVQTLQTTAAPSELLELAKDLDTVAPGLYREQILTAARQALSMGSSNQLGTNVELGPIFRMLQDYGGQSTADNPASTDPGNFNNAVALANLPEGQGLNRLVQMAQSSTGSSQTIATEMIAQLAGQNPQAYTTLMQMAQDGQIPNSAWVGMAPILGGSQYQVGNPAGTATGGDAAAPANQNYSIVNGATTPDQINQRITMINNFLNVVPPDSAAAAALQHQRQLLSGKLSN